MVYKFDFFSCNARQHKSCINMHIVQHLMSSQGEKRWIWDDFTCFPKYSLQMTIARSEDINKEGTSILNLKKTLLLINFSPG